MPKYKANQLTSFCVMKTFAFNELMTLDNLLDPLSLVYNLKTPLK